MKTSIPTLFLALAVLAGTALPAAAVPQGPPSFILDTEQAYVMTPLSAFAGGGAGGLTIRNGLPGSLEWFLMNTGVNLNPASFGTRLGGKYQFMQTMGGMAGAVYGSLNPAFAANTFGLGLNAGLAFSQSLIFGNISFDPNVAVNNLTSGAVTNLNLNVALIAPLGGGWLVTLQDVPSYGLNGGGFTNQAKLGGRFVPANNTALDITVAQLDGSTFQAGLLGVTGYVGW
jgi:hypothetical protein